MTDSHKTTKDPSATYYDEGGIDTLDFIKAKLTAEQFTGYLLGQSLKYLGRFNHKHLNQSGRLRDARKAAFYANALGYLDNPVDHICPACEMEAMEIQRKQQDIYKKMMNHKSATSTDDA